MKNQGQPVPLAGGGFGHTRSSNKVAQYQLENPIGSGSRERKFSQKIYVEGLFPAHIKPASVLIGTRGMNHNRMQTSGCTVQLRGKGCSQPSSQWPEEPVHLFVKYDTEEQFEKFKEILKSIVEGYDSQNPKRNRSFNAKSRNDLQLPLSIPAVIEIPHWRPDQITEAQITAEVELLWLIRVFLVKENSVYLDNMESRVSSFFCMDSLNNQLQNTSIPPGPNRFENFVKSCSHCLLIHEDVDSRLVVGLYDNIKMIQKESLRELHNFYRKEQASIDSNMLESNAYSASSTITPQSNGNSGFGNINKYNMLQPDDDHYSTNNSWRPSPGRDDLPSSCLCVLLQALHFLIFENTEMPFSGLEERFLAKYDLPLQVSAFGYPSTVSFVKAFPNIFRVAGNNGDLRIVAAEYPDFDILATNNFQIFPDTTNANHSGNLGSRNNLASSQGPSFELKSIVNEKNSFSSFSGLSALAAIATSAARNNSSGKLSAPGATQDSVALDKKNTEATPDCVRNNQMSSAKDPKLTTTTCSSLSSQKSINTPRLLGLLGKLVSKS